jgi:acetyltransferase-like isoleucine patch superfamily enzyme
MNLFERIVRRLKFERWRRFRPAMYQAKFNPADGARLNNTRISNTVFMTHERGIDIGDNVYIGHYGILDGSNGITIEEGCQLAAWNGVFSHSSHISVRLYGKNYGGTEMDGYVRGPVHIGKYTFVGSHALIMPGTKIGKGSIVAAYSLVKGEFPDFSIIAGNPAKVIGDTRKADEPYLKENPELQKYYDEWAK